MGRVRRYEPSDARALERCFVELQAYERAIETNRVDGKLIGEAYVVHMLDECRRWDGCIFVAEDAGEVVGFACVLARFDTGDILEATTACAYLTDILVSAGVRGRGIGQELLGAAESFAREHGAQEIRLSVLAGNAIARRFYERTGFRELEVGLTKPL